MRNISQYIFMDLFSADSCQGVVDLLGAYTLTATNHDGHKIYHDGHSNENVNKKAVLSQR